MRKVGIILTTTLILCRAQTGDVPLSTVDNLIQKADIRNEEYAYKEEMEILQMAQNLEPENFEVIWRLAQVHFNLSDNSNNEEVIRENIYSGFGYAERALEMKNDRAEAHKWYGILIGRVGELEGTEQKIKNSYKVAEHTLKAVELDPEDDGNYHVMGRWHYTLADLSWFERTIAGLVYEDPPEASFEEARSYFEKAIQKAPDEIRHYLWLGKTMVELDMETEAAEAWGKALDLQARSESDRLLQDEARELLNDL